MLTGWVKSGANVDFFMVGASQKTVAQFQLYSERLNIALANKSGAGSFRALQIKCKNSNGKKSNFASEFFEHHPTLFNLVDGKAMWIEGRHPIDSMYAYDVEFVPPSAMNKERLQQFDAYVKKLATLAPDSDKIDI